jgi:hypothetical protein
VRWLLDDRATKMPWGGERKRLDMIRCRQCARTPPERSAFLMLESPYCVECLRGHIAETEEVQK